MMTDRIEEDEWLHPRVRMQFLGLEHRLEGRFRIFETVRTPERQYRLKEGGSTGLDPWKSAHQYGLAADFVGLKDGVMSWDPMLNWEELAVSAISFGLVVPDVKNDPGHVELVGWRKLVLL